MTSPGGPAGVFDRAAATYDSVGIPFFGPIADGLVAALAPRPGERALDVGCGRGAVLAPLARLVGPSGSALGIDLAPEMVRRTAADLADLPWVEVRVDDASAPALPARSFDLVASSLVLFFLPDPGAALRRWAELLVPDGRLGVTTFGEQDPRWRQVDAVFEPYLPPSLKDARTSGTTGPFDSDAGMETLLADAGLVDVRTVRRTVDVRFRDVEQLLDFTWSHGQRAMWEAVPTVERDAVRAAIVERAAGLGLGPAGFALTQDVRYTLARRTSAHGG
jgi:ubiquinone/menaquinone biosynthesis C-methylase UbiE